MELDDLKGAWRQQTLQTAKVALSDDALHAMLRAKATNLIDSLKRSILFEFWFTVIFIIVCLGVGFKTTDQMIRNISLITMIISLGFGIFYYKKVLLLNNLKMDSKSLKENVTNLTIQFEKFLLFYRRGYNILIPVALIAGALIGLHVSTEKNLMHFVSQPKFWLLLSAILIPITILFDLGMKWYLRKLYGNHLLRLHSLLLELSE